MASIVLFHVEWLATMECDNDNTFLSYVLIMLNNTSHFQ